MKEVTLTIEDELLEVIKEITGEKELTDSNLTAICKMWLLSKVIAILKGQNKPDVLFSLSAVLIRAISANELPAAMRMTHETD